MTTVACVLKSGGCYDAEDVAHLRCGISQHLPGARFVCFSDVQVPCERIPLRQDWPGWWSKMSLFDPDLCQDDLLYFDLDTMITGPLADIAATPGPAILRDFYRPQGLQSSVMKIPHSAKLTIWKGFCADPVWHMDRCSTPDKWGDQGFIEEHWLLNSVRWQDAHPGRFVSYKVDNLHINGVPAGASVVVFHGQPKPRDIGWTL